MITSSSWRLFVSVLFILLCNSKRYSYAFAIIVVGRCANMDYPGDESKKMFEEDYVLLSDDA